MFKIIFLIKLACFASVLGQLQDVFEWKELAFVWPSEEIKNNALSNGDYIPENNMPAGLARWKDKLFVTVPREKPGVAAGLNYIPLTTTEKSPALIPYPDFQSNQLPKTGEPAAENQIVSPFRLKVDACDRLWVLDAGLSSIKNGATSVIAPFIAVFDLNTDKLLRRYNFKPTDIVEDSLLANIIVDVTNETCDKAFAYSADLNGNAVIVYSFAENVSWKVTHYYFHFDPLMGDMNLEGINFQWSDGIFGMALGPINEDGFRTFYFHSLASISEFSVSTEVLRNETMATDTNSFHLYKFEGKKGEQTQSLSSHFDEKTNVILVGQVLTYSIACWNTKTKLSPTTFQFVAQDREKLVYPNDISVDTDRNLWVLSDKMPIFLYGEMDYNKINFRILKTTVDEAIKGTVCEGSSSSTSYSHHVGIWSIHFVQALLFSTSVIIYKMLFV